MFKRDLTFRIPQFNTDDAGGGASSPPASNPDAGNSDGGEDGNPSPPSFDYVPEKFVNKETGEPEWEKLATSYKELEKKRGEIGEDKLAELKTEWENDRLKGRPDDPSGYNLPDDERYDAEALAASPIVALWREAAHSAGLGQDAFNEVLGKYAEQTIADEKARMESEFEALGETAQERIDAAGSWAEKHFPAEEFSAISQVANTAAGVKALERIMNAMSESSSLEVLGDGGASDGKLTESEVMKLMDSKAYIRSDHPDHAKVQKQVADYWASQR